MKPDAKIATITLNPAIDQTIVIPNFSMGFPFLFIAFHVFLKL